MSANVNPPPVARGRVRRHLLHLIGGCIPPVLGLLLPRAPLLVFLGFLSAVFVTAEAIRFLYPPFNRVLISRFSRAADAFKEAETARPIGATYYIVASFLAFLLFPRDAAIAALLFVAVGDPAAAIVGRRLGRRKIGRKSVEGSLAFFASSLAVAAILIWGGLSLTWPAVVAGALSAAVTELLPFPIDDNLSVPIVSALVMALMLAQP